MSLEELLAWIPPGSPDEALARQVNFEQLPASNGPAAPAINKVEDAPK